MLNPFIPVCSTMMANFAYRRAAHTQLIQLILSICSSGNLALVCRQYTWSLQGHQDFLGACAVWKSYAFWWLQKTAHLPFIRVCRRDFSLLADSRKILANSSFLSEHINSLQEANIFSWVSNPSHTTWFTWILLKSSRRYSLIKLSNEDQQ